VFLLSPAYCAGKRGEILLGSRAAFPLARELAAGTATLAGAFAFVSGLYFRGKLAYAERFGGSGPGVVNVITPTRGLQPPQHPVSAAVLREFAEVDVAEQDPRYRAPLERDAAVLRAALPAGGEVVLLGSIATGKYVEVLGAIFGERLVFPRDFVGRGDMSRGALLLRAAREGRELPYVPVLDTPRRGRRAPRLAETACGGLEPERRS
jgi:hypothetical protein